jgi:hypothetical protein
MTRIMYGAVVIKIMLILRGGQHTVIELCDHRVLLDNARLFSLKHLEEDQAFLMLDVGHYFLPAS